MARKKDNVNEPNKSSDENQSGPKTAQHHDDTDVQAALKRTTADGPGEDPAPESDFESFATQGVEKEAELLPIPEVASQVLAGHWGPSAEVANERLKDAGYDVDLVNVEVRRRKNRGAPSAF